MTHYTYLLIEQTYGLFHYTGVRSCEGDPREDGYRGSGGSSEDNLLKLAKKKFGVENFYKIILNEYDTREEANKDEARLVKTNKQDPCSLNLVPGGDSLSTGKDHPRYGRDPGEKNKIASSISSSSRGRTEVENEKRRKTVGSCLIINNIKYSGLTDFCKQHGFGNNSFLRNKIKKKEFTHSGKHFIVNEDKRKTPGNPCYYNDTLYPTYSVAERVANISATLVSCIVRRQRKEFTSKGKEFVITEFEPVPRIYSKDEYDKISNNPGTS